MKKVALKPAATVLLTGLIALCLSALPLLFLQFDDMLLFSTTHSRAYQNTNVAFSGDDIYLARALINQRKLQIEMASRYTLEQTEKNFYVSPNLNPESMTQLWGADGGRFFAKQIEALMLAKVLANDYGKAVQDLLMQQNTQCFYSTDTAGFLFFNAYASEDATKMGDSFCSFTIESRTGKIVTMQIKMPRLQEQKAPDLATVQNYLAYLELDALSDWIQPENTPFAQSGLYSANAQLLAYCSQDTILKTDTQIIEYSLVPLEEKQIALWQKYMNSQEESMAETSKR